MLSMWKKVAVVTFTCLLGRAWGRNQEWLLQPLPSWAPKFGEHGGKILDLSGVPNAQHGEKISSGLFNRCLLGGRNVSKTDG